MILRYCFSVVSVVEVLAEETEEVLHAAIQRGLQESIAVPNNRFTSDAGRIFSAANEANLPWRKSVMMAAGFKCNDGIAP
jgi:hypothetical protein